MEDILGRSLRILVLLREAEPEALSLGEIMKGIGMDHRAVTPSIKGLVEWGFVVVEKEKVGQRPVPIHLHKLTRAGREVADQAIKTDATAKRLREGHHKGKTNERT